MKLNINHATPSSAKPLADAVWDEAHDVTAPAHSLGNLGASVTIDLGNGSVQTGTLDANCTVTLPSVAAGTTEHLTLLLTNDGTAGRAVTVTGVAWVTGAAPDFNDAASATNIIVLRGTSAGWIADGGSYA